MIFCARAMRERFHVCPAFTHRGSGLVRLVARERLSRIFIPIRVENEGLTIEFSCGLSGDERKFFRSGERFDRGFTGQCCALGPSMFDISHP